MLAGLSTSTALTCARSSSDRMPSLKARSASSLKYSASLYASCIAHEPTAVSQACNAVLCGAVRQHLSLCHVRSGMQQTCFRCSGAGWKCISRRLRAQTTAIGLPHPALLVPCSGIPEHKRPFLCSSQTGRCWGLSRVHLQAGGVRADAVHHLLEGGQQEPPLARLGALQAPRQRLRCGAVDRGHRHALAGRDHRPARTLSVRSAIVSCMGRRTVFKARSACASPNVSASVSESNSFRQQPSAKGLSVSPPEVGIEKPGTWVFRDSPNATPL